MISMRKSDGPRFYNRNEGGGEFLFRASGRHPTVQIPLVEALLLNGSNTRTDGLTVTKLLFHALSRTSDVSVSEKKATTRLHVTRSLRTIWPSLHGLCCSNQNSQSRARRSGAAISFQLPWRTSNHHCSESDSSDTLEEKKTLVLHV